MHLNAYDSVAAACLASASFNIEAESSFLVSAEFCFRKACEQITNVIEHSRIGRRVGTRCFADRRLVNVDHFVNILKSEDFVELSGFLLKAVCNPRGTFVQDFVDQTALSGA